MKLKLAYYNDPFLRKKAERVNQIDDDLRQFVADMIETMHATDGIGLAAPQVKRSIALFITFVSRQGSGRKKSPPEERVFINPTILSYSESKQTFTEGCMSIPNMYFNVTRPSQITFQATDLNGQTFEETMQGFEATNFMHEYDHLQGILITDYLPPSEKQALKELLTAK